MQALLSMEQAIIRESNQFGLALFTFMSPQLYLDKRSHKMSAKFTVFLLGPTLKKP